MRALFLCALVLSIFQLSAEAQSEADNLLPAFKRVSFSAMADVGYLKPIDIQHSEVESSTSIGVGGALLFNYSPVPKLTLSTGIAVKYFRLSHQDYRVTTPCDIDPATGIDTRNSYIDVTSESFFAGLPLFVKYNFLTRPNTPFVRLGTTFFGRLDGTYNIALAECGVTSTEIANLNDPNQGWLILPRLSLGYSLQAFTRLRLLVEGYGEFSPQEQTFNGMFTEVFPEVGYKIFNTGVAIGVEF